MSFLGKFINLVFPPYCLVCKLDGSLWCIDCKKNYIFQPIQKCIVCKKESPNGRTHKRCQHKTTIDYFLRFGKYTKDIQEVVHFLKFHHGRILGRDIAEFYYQTILNNEKAISIDPTFPLWRDGKSFYFDSSDIDPGSLFIVPIPIHLFRKLERGYNQAEVIAKELSKLSNIPYTNLLKRRKHTKRQSDLDKTHRYSNIQNAFKICKKHQIPIDSTILLLDDITTTGSTLNEAAKVLKQNGYKKIVAICIGRG